MPIRSVARITLLGMLLALPPVGCRKEPDYGSFEGDMGDNGVILLPTDSTWIRAADAEGQAEWQPFRKPDEQPPEVEPDGGTATAANDVGANVESVLREFISTYNDVVKETKTDDDVEGLLDYYIDEQRDTLTPVFKVVAALVTTDAELRVEFEKRLADAPDRLATTETALGDAAPYALSVASFRDVTDTLATADLTPGSLFTTCSFVQLDQDWYLKAPEGDAPATAQAAAEAALATRKGWLSALQADPPDVASVIQAIEAAAHANAPKPEDTTAPDDDDDANKSADEDGGD